ncbi:MAG: Gfo/Idh/MocA family oxidoreductase [Planctomycetes bacterium]|nr:Gfo/Idh/MocA family oxidoreductase [Planctomycetota bacterium]
MAYKVGIIDLDTSHPGAFTDIMKEMDDLDVVTVFDRGAVHDPGYADEFAEKHGVPNVASSMEDLIGKVDIVFVQSANWDDHLEPARLAIEAGKALFIDKPIVGNVRDGLELIDLVKTHEALVMCGSSLRWPEEIDDLKARIGDFGGIQTVFSAGPNDLCNYGIHIIEMVHGAFGTGIRCVTHIGENGADLYKAVYASGLTVIFQTQVAGGFEMTVVGAKKKETLKMGVAKKPYACLLEAIARMLDEKKMEFTIEQYVEAVNVLIAAKIARQTGRTIALEDLTIDDGFDGTPFIKEYRTNARARK